MKIDNLYNVMWLKEVRETLYGIKSGAKERIRFCRADDDNDSKATAECVKSAIEEAIEKIEKAFENL